MKVFKKTACIFSALLLASSASFASKAAVNLSYANTDFNSTSPGWSDTLTIYNNGSSSVVMTNLAFETNYATLDTAQLYGTIYHPAASVVPVALGKFDYQYQFKTESPWSSGVYTVIPANGSVTLTQIPLAHDQISQNGIPLYYQLPYNIQVTLNDGSIVKPMLNGMCSGAACDDPAAGKMVGAYYTDWANYHSGPQNLLMPNQIPLANMNTIYYDVAKVDRNTAAVSFVDVNHDQYYVPAFATLKQQYPYLNLMYSFGGWGDEGSNSYPSYDLAYIFDKNDPQLIQTLAQNMVNTIRELGFNGIDIDYEWSAIQPGTTDGMVLTPVRVQGFELLLQDIRKELNAIQPADNAKYYKLTAAVFAGKNSVDLFVQNGGDWAKVASTLDYLGVMTYDMHGQFDVSLPPPDNITGFLSNMQNSHIYTQQWLNYYDVADAILAYEGQKVPLNKMILGIPAYTRIEKTAGGSSAVTDENKGTYLTLAASNLQPAGESGSGGTTDYKCIVNNTYCWGGFSFGSGLVYVPANFSGQGLGALEKTPWAYDKSQNWFMAFDDGISAKYKGQWAKQQGLGGIMIWEIDGDIPLTDSNYKKTSLIFNGWNGFLN